MKAAYRGEAAYRDEERIASRIAPPKATPEPKKAPLRDYFWWELAERHARPSLYISPESEEDVGEYTFVLDLADRAIDELHERYQFRDDIAVRNFLRGNVFLVGLLDRAFIEIRECFGPDTPVALDVLREPDAKNGGRLFVLILTTLPPREAVSRLDALDQGWWLDVLPAASGKVTIDIDYG